MTRSILSERKIQIISKSILSLSSLVAILILVACSEDEPGNRAPSILDQRFSVSENAEDGFVVGTIEASDPDGDFLTYSITSGNEDNIFSIRLGGQLRISSGENLNFQSSTQHLLSVEVSDGFLSSSALITVTVIDEENRPPVIAPQTFSISEDAQVGDEVGVVVASDPDNDDLRFEITNGNENSTFGINQTTGSISITSIANLDFETTSSYDLTIQVQDEESLSATTSVTINVLDVEEPTSSFELAGSTFTMNDGLIREFGTSPVSGFHFGRTYSLTDGDFFFSIPNDDFLVDGGTIGVFGVLFSSSLFSFEPGEFIYVDTASTTVGDVLGKSFIYSSAIIIDGNDDGSVSINEEDIVYGIIGGSIEVTENPGINNYTLFYNVKARLYDVANKEYGGAVWDLKFIYTGQFKFSDEKGRKSGDEITKDLFTF